MRKFSTFLILAGILLALYPFMDRGYTWYMQQKIEETYSDLDEVFINEPENTTPVAVESAGTPAAVVPPAVVPETVPTPPTEQTPAAPQVQPAAPVPEAPKAVPKPLGVIKISKINLKLPIMKGATTGNMKIGAGWMKQTTPIGQNGNTAIAAHRSYTRGRFFNRLDEMAVGDDITIISEGKEYHYTVFNVVVVEPTDVSVLRGKKSESIVTLITCTPIRVATHRLIVQGKLVQ